MAESLQQTLQNTRSTLAAQPGAPEFTTRDESADALSLYKAKREREARTSTTDYLGAMWRQDSPVDGVMASVVGSEFAPDPNYAPFSPEEWKKLTEGIPSEFHHNFYKATSPAHALFIKQRLQDKLDDLQKLGDLDTAGNVGRFLFNVVEPTSLLAGVASGGILKAATGMSAAARAARGVRTVADAEKAAASMATAAARQSSAGAMAADFVGGVGGNAAIEKLRQSVNFEDSTAEVVEAALMGAMLWGPFAYLNNRELRQVVNTATAEHQAFSALRRVHEGQPLDASDLKALEGHQKLAPDVILVDSKGTARASLSDAERFSRKVDDDLRAMRDEPEEAPRGTPEEAPKGAQPNRMPVDKDLFVVVGEDGQPMHFGTQREAGRWILSKGNKLSDDQIWQIANHPSGKGFAVQQAGFREKQQAKARKGPTPEEAKRMQEEAQARFDRDLEALAAKKKAELDELTSAGKVSADDAVRLLEDLTAKVRGKKAKAKKKKAASKKAKKAPKPAPEEQALADELGMSPDELDAAIRGDETPAEAPKGEPKQEQIEGTEVYWRGGGEGDFGTVVGVHENGKLKIDRAPYLEPHIKTVDGQPRYAFKHRSELDPDSPLYQDVTPEGFGPGTAGAAQAGGTNIPQADVSPDFDNTTNMARWRLDLFARLNRSGNPAVQYLAHILVKDAIGNSKEYAQRWTASERKRQWQRVLGGHFHQEAKVAFNEVRKIRNISLVAAEQGVAREFYENVSRVVRGDKDVLAQNSDIAPQLQRAAKAMQETYATMAELAKKHGLEGAEGLTPDAAYVNRVWNHDAIRKMEITHGEPAVIEMLAGAINQRAVDRFKKSPRYQQMVAAGRGTDADIRRAKATSFLAAVKQLEFSPAIQDVHLMAHDMFTLRDTLKKDGLSDDQIDNIVDIMFEAKEGEADAGRPTNLKFRFDLDENHSVNTKAGKLRMTDLMENDSRLLVDIYLNSMAGHTALAEKGITSRAAFQKELENAREWYAQNEQATKDAGQINREIQMLEDVYSHITGRPMSMQNFNTEDRVAGALRAYARASFLGQLGVASAFEMVNAMALTSVRAFFQHSGGFRGFIQAVRTGKLADKDLAQQIEAWTGFGQEAAASYARQSEVTDFTYDRSLNKFENYGNKASHVVDIISGNRLFTSLTRQMSAAMFIQKHVNMAGRKLSAKQRERLVHQGVDDADIDSMLSSLKQHTTLGTNGAVTELRWEDWKKADPKSFDTYLLVLNREVRDAIQDHDLGEVPMFMHGTIGKIFGELRTFMVASHAKQFLKGMTYHDSTTLTLWMMSFVGQAMAYSLQTSLNFAHNPAELDKRLTLERIALSSVQRMSVTGVVPALLETGTYTLTGGSSLFSNGSTTNTDNRNIFMTPSGMMLSRALKGVSVGVGAMNPLTDNIVTRQDVKDSLSPLPGANTFLVRNLIDALSSNFPKQEAPSAP